MKNILNEHGIIFYYVNTMLVFAGFFLIASCEYRSLKENNGAQEEKEESFHYVEKNYTEQLLYVENYNAEIIILSLIYLNDCSFLLPNTTILNKENISFDIEKLSCVKKDSIFNQLASHLNSLPFNTKMEKLNKIKSWCDCYYMFNYIVNMCIKQDKELLEIISEIEITRKILDNYLEVEGQGWYSLSSSQINISCYAV